MVDTSHLDPRVELHIHSSCYHHSWGTVAEIEGTTALEVEVGTFEVVGSHTHHTEVAGTHKDCHSFEQVKRYKLVLVNFVKNSRM